MITTSTINTTTNAKTITLNNLKEMLYYLDPNLDYVEWFQVLAGAKYEFGDNAEEMCREWSQGTEANPCYKYKDRAFNATWRGLSANKPNPITIKTVFYLAKKAGWRCDDELITSKAANADADATDLEEEKTDPEVIEEALDLLCNSPFAIAEHPYLKEKGIKQHGLKRLDSSREEANLGALIVPVYDKNFMLQGVQFVSTKNKAYLTGTRPKGCFYCFDGKKDLMYICEGLATAATINEVTGKMTFITFGYGNLEAATLNIQQAFPDSKIVIAADNNAQPADNDNTKNPGVDAARKIFNQHNIPYTYPLFKDNKTGKGYADFNDLRKQSSAKEVSKQLVKNLVENSSKFIEFKKICDKKIAGDTDDDTIITFAPEEDACFISNRKTGLIYQKIHTSDKSDDAGEHSSKKVETTYISQDLRITAKLTTENNEDFLFRAEFIDEKNIPHQCDFQSSLLGSRGNEILQRLIAIGLKVNLKLNARMLLYWYISLAIPEKYLRYVTKTGLIKRESKFTYVLSNEVIGIEDPNEQVVFINSFITENTTNIAQKGTLEEWKENIGKYCKDNTRLIFACCSSFASPFAGVLSKELNGIHYFGESSSGKTSSLKVAASIWGTPSYMGQWLTTANAAEGSAVMRNNLPMILDELSQAKPKEVGSMIYMVSQGKTKGRATTDGSRRKIVEFKTNIISSGEISIESFMASADEKPKAGQEIRLVDIQADAGKGLQSFDCLHDLKSVSYFTSYLHRIVGKTYGVAGLEYVKTLINCANDGEGKIDGLTYLEYWDKLIEDYKNILLAKYDNAEEQVKRVAEDFAVRATAGEMATLWGITGWEEGEALSATMVIFNEWVESRGGCSNKEWINMLNQIKSFMEKNEESCFTNIEARLKAEAEKRIYPKTLNRVGYVKNIGGVGDCYLVFPGQFKEQVCKGLDLRATLKTLQTHGWLHLQPGEQRSQAKVRIPTFHDVDVTSDVDVAYVTRDDKDAWVLPNYGCNNKSNCTEVHWFYVLIKAKVFGELNYNK